MGRNVVHIMDNNTLCKVAGPKLHKGAVLRLSGPAIQEGNQFAALKSTRGF